MSTRNAVHVPRFNNSWTDKMVAFIENQPDPQAYVCVNIKSICQSWGDSGKAYAVSHILNHFGIVDDGVQEVVTSFFS